MRSKRNISVAMCLILGSMFIFTAPVRAEPADNSLCVAIFPRFSATDTVRMYTPLINYLSNKLGREVRLVTSRNFKTFWKALTKGKCGIVHYNQYHYIRSHHEFGYQVILMNEEFGSSTIAGSIIVRKDKGYKTLADLQGKKIVFGGGPKAMQSYITATYLLRKAGLQEGDYHSEFTKNPPNAILAPYFGQADAGGVGDRVLSLPVITRRIDPSKMTFLALSEQLPHLPWAVKGAMPEQLAARIQQVLSSMHTTMQGRQALKSAALTGLRVAQNSDYDKHRLIVLEVLGERY